MADLSGLALELALVGGDGRGSCLSHPAQSRLPTPRRRLCCRCSGRSAADTRITAHGKALAALPLHPRLAHMLLRAGADAAPLAALLADRDPLPRAAPVDLNLRLDALRTPPAEATRGTPIAAR